MRKHGVVLGALALLLAWLPAVAWAESSRVGTLPPALNGQTFETTVVTEDTASVGNFGPDRVIYGFTIHASSAGAECGLYDVATLQGALATQGVYIDEGGEATQYDTFPSNWPSPYRLKTDLTVIVNNGACTIYHDSIP